MDAPVAIDLSAERLERIGQHAEAVSRSFQDAARRCAEAFPRLFDDFDKAAAAFNEFSARLREIDPMTAYQLAGRPYGKSIRGMKKWLRKKRSTANDHPGHL